jgi:putative transcriptional regulator
MPKATKRSNQPEPAQPEAEHRITIHLDEMLIARNLTLVELAARVGVTVANLSILKNGHARAVRFSTLTAICDALDCTPADLIRLDPNPASETGR